MLKQNLVIVHSFPANSYLLEGLYAFLSDYFNVYAVDLPGFTPHTKPLKEVSFDNYARHVEAEIDRLKLKDYILGGISFGFSVVNHCQDDDRCKGFLALEPFINKHYIRADLKPVKLMQAILAFVTTLRIHQQTYRSHYFKRFVLSQSPNVKFDMVQRTVDPYAFFETGKMLLHHHAQPSFHNKPYILVINDEDTAVCGPKIIKLFESLNRSLIVKTTVEHHPSDTSKAYFQKHINPADIEKMLHFIRA